MIRLLARRNLSSDRFGTIAAILGVALGTATVDAVVVLDVNTQDVEASEWASNPNLQEIPDTVSIRGIDEAGQPTGDESAKEETHEDYEVMRSAIRLGSLASFAVGALVVFFTFAMLLERRKREVALLRSLGARRMQVAAVFLAEAAFVGIVGALLGSLAAVPLSYLAAAAGITTTGRAQIGLAELWFPVRQMAVVGLVGASIAVLGVLRPARDILRLEVANTLAPRTLGDGEGSKTKPGGRGMSVLILPFAVMVYVLMRPFFRNALPSLTFFVVEAGLVSLGFLASVLFVPGLTRRLGGALARLVPGRRSATRLLARRRLELAGDEMSWSIGSVMLVFALVLALHIATNALEREVTRWGETAIRRVVFVLPNGLGARVPKQLPGVPDTVTAVRFSDRTPWPNAVHSTKASELSVWAEASGDPNLVRITQRFGPGTTILSTLMARRHRVDVGGFLEVGGGSDTRRLRVVGVTDDLGYFPVRGPYRHSKTYAVLDAADHDLIARFSSPNAAVVLVSPQHRGAVPPWRELLADVPHDRRLRWESGSHFIEQRRRNTARDFIIFDLILGLTTVLAGVGIANQLMLSLHARRREIALLRVLGMTRKQVARFVVLEGAFVGLVGGTLALLLGVPLGYAAIGALEAVSAFEVDFAVSPLLAVGTVALSVVVSTLSSLYPATRVGKSESATSLHYE